MSERDERVLDPKAVDCPLCLTQISVARLWTLVRCWKCGSTLRLR